MEPMTIVAIVVLLLLAYLIYRATQVALKVVLFLLILGLLYFFVLKRVFPGIKIGPL